MSHARVEQQASFQNNEPPGGKPKLLGISRRGNIYLRTLFIHGARAALPWLAKSETQLGFWLPGLLARSHRNTAVVALANNA